MKSCNQPRREQRQQIVAAGRDKPCKPFFFETADGTQEPVSDGELEDSVSHGH